MLNRANAPQAGGMPQPNEGITQVNLHSRTVDVVDTQESPNVTEQSRDEQAKAPAQSGGEGMAKVSVNQDHVERTKLRMAHTIASLRMYNPDFNLTADVMEIMRVFFEDMEPDSHGTVSPHAVFREMERLDPHKEMVSEATRQLLWRDLHDRAAASETAKDRVDFQVFCAWIMRWREISPQSVQHVYTSWAKQLAVVDFGLSESDGIFAVRSEQLPTGDEFRFQLSELLGATRRQKSNRDQPPSLEQKAHERVEFFAPEGEEDEEMLDREAEEPEEATGGSARSHDSMLTVSKSFLAGGLAGIVAKSALAPVDRVKLMFQVSDKRAFSFRNAFHLATEIYTQDGFRALFRGNSLNILRVVPYAGVQHSSFDFFRRRFHAYNATHAEQWKASGKTRDFTKLSNTQLVAAGSMAGGLSLTISYPLDIVRARIMVQQGKHNYTTIYQAIKEMYRVDGARSFTRGLLPSLMGTLPYTGIGFTLNEKFKHGMLELQQRRASSPEDAPVRLHPFSKLMCSYLAACIAQTATYPMDTIRRRIQTDGFVPGNGDKLRYTGVATTARLILANEGWRGFFKGVSVNWMRSPLATGISLTAYDLLKEVLDVETVG